MNNTDALISISKLTSCFLPWTKYAMQPLAIQIALNDIDLNHHLNVLELGSGVSTVFLAEYLYRYSGKLMTVDHDKEWQLTVNGWMSAGAAENTRMIHAPLVPNTFEFNPVRWYDMRILAAALKDLPPFDLLIVDGPPGFEPSDQFNRGLASLLFSNLTPGATVILDDIGRAGERTIAENWSFKLGMDYHDLQHSAGIAVWTTESNSRIFPRA